MCVYNVWNCLHRIQFDSMHRRLFFPYKMSFVQGFILGIKYSNLSKHLKTPWHRENGEHSTQHIAFTTKCRKASSGLHVVHEKSAPFWNNHLHNSRMNKWINERMNGWIIFLSKRSFPLYSNFCLNIQKCLATQLNSTRIDYDADPFNDF